MRLEPTYILEPTNIGLNDTKDCFGKKGPKSSHYEERDYEVRVRQLVPTGHQNIGGILILSTFLSDL